MSKKTKKPKSEFATWFDAQYPEPRTEYDHLGTFELLDLARQSIEAQYELNRRIAREFAHSVALKAWNAAKNPHPEAWTKSKSAKVSS